MADRKGRGSPKRMKGAEESPEVIKKAARYLITFDELGLNAADLIDRMKKTAGLTTDAELADFLAASEASLKFRPAMITGWRARNSIPLGILIVWARQMEKKGIPITLDYIIKGK